MNKLTPGEVFSKATDDEIGAYLASESVSVVERVNADGVIMSLVRHATDGLILIIEPAAGERILFYPVEALRLFC